jgi:glycosyltransferase involved in cell wall biosynthesis
MSKNTDPIISIVIINYTNTKKVKRAIDSALAQTYKHVEVVVLDVGSGPEVNLIYDDFDYKIKLIQLQAGIRGDVAREVALSQCEGEYVAMFYAYSYLEPDVVEKMMTKVEDVETPKLETPEPTRHNPELSGYGDGWISDNSSEYDLNYK